MRCVLEHSRCRPASHSGCGLVGAREAGVGAVEQHLSLRSTSLVAELSHCSPLARICAIKGLVLCLPPEALCCPMQRQRSQRLNPHDKEAVGGGQQPDHDSQDEHGSTWHLLVDGALPAACRAMEEAGDAHMKFQSLQLLVACLQRIRKLLQVHCWDLSP